MSPNEKHIWTHSSRRLITLRNRTCVYCGEQFGRVLARTKEHVIGRRFVPSGSLAGQWNIVAGACAKCNAEKSDLEDDTSIISMLPGLHDRPHELDQKIFAEIQRKSHRSKSRRTGKPVIDSDEHVHLHGQFGAISMKFKFVAPPQVDDARICELARFHVQGFFYQMTFDQTIGSGRFLTGDFHLWIAAPRSNWGAHKLGWFADLVPAWLPSLRADGADGFFRIHLRKHKQLAVLSWALEWNKGLRVVGFVGEEASIRSITSTCPVDEPAVVHHQGNERFLLREHTAISPDQDELFCWDGFGI